MPTYQGVLHAQDLKIGLVVARFNELVTKPLLEGAISAFIRLGGDPDNLSVVWVPGSFELPLAVQKLLAQPEIQGVAALGAVIKGETAHFDFVAGPMSSGLMNVSLAAGKPVALGVLTTDDLEQAQNRAGGKAGNKGAEVVFSLVETLQVLKALD
jgi:6,7-dimethyl-8-ribityllumazine synthase